MTQAPEHVAEVPWRRLDAKMLLVHPVSELTRLAIPLFLLVFVGSGGIDGWHVAVVVIPIALGIWRYATTQFRITPEHLELREGIVGRHVTRARLDRVRTVALDASPIHRVLSLSKVKIGTGDDARLELNALGTGQARALRASLLHRVAEEPALVDPVIGAGIASPPIPDSDEVLLAFDPRWLLLAPFTGTGLAIAAGAVAAGSGPLQEPVGDLLGSASDRTESIPLLALVAGGAFLAGVLLVVLSVAGYALANWGFRFSRDRAGRSWHLTKGLLTTSETSVDVARVRGLSLCRPAGLRLVNGGTARAMVTGLREEQSKSSAQIAPAAPYRLVHELVLRVAGDDEAVEGRLLEHGPRARRRQLLAPLRGLLELEAVVAVVVLAADLNPWLLSFPLILFPVALWIGFDRYDALGHLLTEHHLVAGEPRVSRHRNLVLRRGIIGWRIQQSFFQRRLGLVTLVATTAAGEKAYEVVDLDEDAATALANQAVPALVSQFLADGAT